MEPTRRCSRKRRPATRFCSAAAANLSLGGRTLLSRGQLSIDLFIAFASSLLALLAVAFFCARSLFPSNIHQSTRSCNSKSRHIQLYHVDIDALRSRTNKSGAGQGRALRSQLHLLLLLFSVRSCCSGWGRRLCLGRRFCCVLDSRRRAAEDVFALGHRKRAVLPIPAEQQAQTQAGRKLQVSVIQSVALACLLAVNLWCSVRVPLTPHTARDPSG